MSAVELHWDNTCNSYINAYLWFISHPDDLLILSHFYTTAHTVLLEWQNMFADGWTGLYCHLPEFSSVQCLWRPERAYSTHDGWGLETKFFPLFCFVQTGSRNLIILAHQPYVVWNYFSLNGPIGLYKKFSLIWDVIVLCFFALCGFTQWWKPKD